MRTVTTFVFLVSFLAGQCQEYVFSRLTEEDGLPVNNAYCFLKDNQGFMWIGTANGLCRYDGSEFRYFTQEQGYDISSDHINELFQDEEGIIWIGTNSGGLNSFDPKTNTFESFTHDPANPNSIAADRIQSMAEQDANTLWIGFDNGGGISKMNKITKQFTNYDPFETLEVADVKAIRDMVFDKEHNKLWLGTTVGLISFDLGNEKFELIDHPLAPQNRHTLFALEQLDENRLIGGFFHAGIDIYNIREGRWEEVFHDPSDPIRVFNLSRKSDTEYWVAARRRGLAIYNLNTKELSFVHSDKDNQNTPFPGFTYEVYSDQNEIWVGSSSGVSYSYLKTNPFVFNSLNFSNPEMGRVFDVSGKYDKIYMVGFDNQIWEIDKVTQKREVYKVQGSAILSLSSILELEDRLYIIGINNKVLRFDKISKKISELNFSINKPRFAIKSIKQWREDKALILSGYGGSFILDLKTDQIKSLNNNIIDDQWQQDILVQKDSMLWIGASSSIIIYDPKNDTTSIYNPKAIESKRQKQIHRIINDPSGNTWLGTGHGLVKIENGKETLFNVLNSDLPGNMILDIEFDKQGYMWIITHKGVSRIHTSTMEIVHFDRSDGLEPEGTLANVDGEIYYGTLGGYFNLSQRTQSSITPRPNIYVTEFQVPDKSFQLDSSIDFTNQIHLEYWNNSFSFSFTSPSFNKSSKIKYAYRLVGLNDEWTTVQSRNYANYTNLDGGTYTFEVKAKTRDTEWGEAKKVIVKLATPFWETQWFYTLCATAVFLLGLTIYKIRVRAIQRIADMEAQELQVEALQKRLLDLNLNPFEKQLDIKRLNDVLKDPLTEREFEVLELSLQEKTNAEIGEQLFVSKSTVKFHLRNTYKKLGVRNRREALIFVNKTS